MIGWRRHSESLNPSKAAKAEAKAASREAFVVRRVQSSLRGANLREYRVGGRTLLTEPVLVFFKRGQDQDLRVFDQAAKQLGAARWSQNKEAKLEGYGIYDVDDEVPALAINWRIPSWLGVRSGYTVSDSEGIEIATVSARETQDHAQAIIVGGERIGYLRRPWRKPVRVEDIERREVARIRREPLCNVAEIGTSLAGPLRTVAVVASIIVGVDAESSGGGGGG